jgi:hypothetical protein
MTNKIVTIPENINEMTLGQWQRIAEAGGSIKTKELLDITYGLKSIKDIKNIDIDYLIDAIKKVVPSEKDIEDKKFQLQREFVLDDVKYGFIPNLDDISFGELIDLDEFTDIKNYHKLMSILYRPITQIQTGGRYKIEKYKDVGDLSGMPLGIALGAVSFFLTLGQQLTNAILSSLKEEGVPQAWKWDTLKSGDGSVRSILLQMGI